MRKSIIILLSFIVFNAVLFTFYSCQKKYIDDGCGGSGTPTTCFTVTDINLTTATIGADTLKDGTYGQRHAIVATYTGESALCFRPNRKVWNFMNTAYACTPVNKYRFNDAILSLEIISEDDFDTTHPSGTDITGYFSLPDLNASELYEEQYQPLVIGEHFFVLEYSPAKKGTYHFTVKYTFESGNVIETKGVTLNISE